MTPEQARTLVAGDRLLVGEIIVTVTKVMRYSGPMGTSGPYVVEGYFEGGGEIRLSGDFVMEAELLPRPAPHWYGGLWPESDD